MSKELKAIQQLLRMKASEEHRVFLEKMIPGKQKIYGVKTPALNELAKEFRSGSFSLADELWKAGALEERIIAVKMMEKKGKEDPDRLLSMFQRFAGQAGNWAVCDGLGMQFLRSIVKTHEKEIFALAGEYNRSVDPWQRRLSLVMVEWYTRDPRFHPAIKKLMKNLEKDEEYYVKKAVAWIKRNLARGN